MRYRTAAIAFIVVVVSLFFFQNVMAHLADKHVEQGLEISPTMRFLFAVETFWGQFWWLMLLPLAALFFGAAFASQRVCRREAQ